VPEKVTPEDAPRAVRKYLETLDDAAFGAASAVKPKFTSHSDPASQWTGARGGPAYLANSANYLIDTHNCVILDVEAIRSVRQAEVGAVRTLVDRVKATFDLTPERLIADTAYGTSEMLDWLDRQRGIVPHIPVIDKSGRKDGTIERADFTYDAERDAYICPGGNELKQYRRAFTTPRSGANKDDTIRYRARKPDCDACALKTRCCPKEPQRKVTRSVFEPSRDVAPRHRSNHAIRNLVQAQEEGRDAVRPPETHPSPRAAPIAWPKRRPRRISPRSQRPEPQKARQAPPATAKPPSGVRRKTTVSISRRYQSGRTEDFFNEISGRSMVSSALPHC
jgi:hypothetical protein